nr:hypothetical protein Hi04_10k_c2089_00008 [uncultured bacterium]
MGRDEFIKELIVERLPEMSACPNENEDSTAALFAKWAEEDSNLSKEQIASESEAWQQMQRNMNETRELTREEPLF